MKKSQKLVVLAILAISLNSIQIAQAKPKAKADDLANYSIIHAIPSGFGADIVDVYANKVLVIDNATPGAMKSFAVPRGKIAVQIYANGVIPGPTTKPLLESSSVYLTNGNNFSFVAHLTADEKPKLSIFKNMLTEAGSKRSWLTIRNVAATTPLQVRLNGLASFVPLASEMERKKSLVFNTYSIDALYSETSTVGVAPISVTIKKSSNVVLYIWGAKSKGNLGFLKEEIPARK